MDNWHRNRTLPPDDADFERDGDDRKERREQDVRLKEKLDDKLDKALEESFPGSDPISVTQPAQSIYDRHKR
ncbi:MAG TPA: hypothetical protein VMJ52_02005 [Xanthobacteraceae bacterium]|nr:hypothetical protein [Xanthobacteraceae bacterium]